MNNKFVVDLLRSLLILMFQFVGFDNLFMGLFFFYYLQDWIRVCTDEHCLANTGSSDSRSRRLSNNEANYTCADKYIMNDFFLCLLATLCSVPAALELPNAVSLICHKLSHQNHWPDTTTLKQQTLTFSILDMVKPVFKPVLLFVGLNDALTLKISWCYTQKMVINNMLK